MKKSYIIALVIAVAAVLWVLSGSLDAPAPEPEKAAAASGKNEIMQVRVREIAAEPMVHDVIVTGRSYASREVVLKAETEGQVTEILREKGAVVAANEPLAKLEERDRLARVNETRERVKQREIEYNAAKSLEIKGFNSKVRLAQARADLEQARAALKKAEIALDNMTIEAPFDGVIHAQAIEIGDYVSIGDELFTIVDLDPVSVIGYVTEHDIREIEVGSPASARLVDGRELEGTVAYIAPAADPQTRTFQVEIAVPNPDNEIKEGMTAEIHLPVSERRAHKISPSILTLNDAGQVGVKIVTDDNKVQFVPVTIMADHPDFMWVSGLPEKARAITVGQEFVVEGQAVKPVAGSGDGLL